MIRIRANFACALCRGFIAVLLFVNSAAYASQAPDPRPAASPLRARQAVRDVLASRDFEHLVKVDRQSWWDRLRLWLFDQLEKVARAIQGIPVWLQWVILVWLVLTLVAILAHMIWTLVMLMISSSTRESAGAGEQGFGEQWLGIRHADFASVYKRARQLIESGDWPMAIRYVYVSGLLFLQDRGRIQYQQSKTNKDYVRELSNLPTEQQLLSQMTGVFENATYGTAAPSQQYARNIWQLLDRMMQKR